MRNTELANGVAEESLALNITEAARLLGVSERSAYRMANLGLIPSLRIGGRRLVPVAELKELIAQKLRDKES